MLPRQRLHDAHARAGSCSAGDEAVERSSSRSSASGTMARAASASDGADSRSDDAASASTHVPSYSAHTGLAAVLAFVSHWVTEYFHVDVVLSPDHDPF